MKTLSFRLSRFVLLIFIFLSSTLSIAQENTQEPLNLLELLTEVKNARKIDGKLNAQREAEFFNQQKQQQTLVKAARETLQQLELKSQNLEDEFRTNEQTVQQRKDQLDRRLGNLKALFGHLTAASGDLSSKLQASIISAQYSGRSTIFDELIKKMNHATLLPQVDEIEALWIEMLREMTESSRVVRFSAQVTDPSGKSRSQQVIRIGSFNLLSDNQYLSYSPQTSSINQLARQPASHYLDAIQTLTSGEQSYTRVGIDPTGPSGGSYLSALVDSPSLTERWHQGGVVGYLISAIGIVAIFIVVWRLLDLIRIESSLLKLLKQKNRTANHTSDNALSRILSLHASQPELSTEALEALLSEAILGEQPAIEKFIPLLKIIAMVAPLLGLLGTVAGMIITFQAITIFGAGDPKAMAGGISSALVTTVLGLLVAIPSIFAHALLNAKAQNILHILEHQSMALIALHTQSPTSTKPTGESP